MLNRSEKPLSQDGSSPFNQEKLMVGLLVVFFLGVFSVLFLPQPLSFVIMPVTIALTVWVLYKL